MQLIFPTAEGYGKNATGGRGGQTLRVTNLNNDGEGSFRWALQQEFTRNIIFDVAGTINITTDLVVSGASRGNFTIYGQTAPGELIINSGFFQIQNLSNIVILNLTIRSYFTQNQRDCLTVFNCQNVYIDHCSTSYGGDEQISITGDNGGYTDLITLSNCLMAESDPDHNTGTLIGNFSNADQNEICRASVFNNVWVDIDNRFPNVNGPGHFEVFNNTVYNHFSRLNNHFSFTQSPDRRIIYAENYYKLGSFVADRSDKRVRLHKLDNTTIEQTKINSYGNIVSTLDNIRKINNTDQFSIFTTGNGYTINDLAPSSIYDNTIEFVNDFELKTAEDSYNYNLNNSGNRIFSSDLDNRYIESIRNDTGVYPYRDVSEWDYPNLSQVNRPEGYDSIVTGVPDTWSNTHGITSETQVKAEYVFQDYKFINTDGYNPFEIYLSSITNRLIKTPLKFSEKKKAALSITKI